LVVAASAALGALGVDHPAMPHHRAVVGGATAALRLGLELAPTLVFAVIGVQTLRRRTAAGGAPASEATAGTPATAAATATTTPSDASALELPGARGRLAWVVFGAVLLLFVAAGAGAAGSVRDGWARMRPLMPDDAAPHFVVQALDGGQRFGTNDLRGHVTLVDFWATWCPPCVAAIPHLAALHRDLAPRGLQTLSVNVEPDNPDGVRIFARERQLPFGVWLDHGNAQSAFRVSTFPTVFLVDAQGTVRHIHVGTTSAVTLRHELEALLDEGEARAAAPVP
jgi:thiol-disulfide isomerase/thioredoxin